MMRSRWASCSSGQVGLAIHPYPTLGTGQCHFILDGSGLNSKIAIVQKRAYDFRNRDNFKIAVYFHRGRLNLCPASVTHSKVGLI